jgi:membrane protein
MGRLTHALGVAKTVVRVAYEQQIKYPAAALAYYAFVSFVPWLLLVFALVGEDVAIEIYKLTPRFLTPDTQQLIYQAMTAASGRIGAAALAIGVLAWSGANIAVDFLTVVERIENGSSHPIRTQFRATIVVLGSLSLAIIAILVTSALVGLLPTGPIIGFAGFLALVAVLTLVFLPLYYVPSDLLASPQRAVPGAITAAVGWALMRAGVHFYAVNAGRYAIYGVLSGVILILTGLYLAAGLLMLGVVVNAVLVGGTDEPLTP